MKSSASEATHTAAHADAAFHPSALRWTPTLSVAMLRQALMTAEFDVFLSHDSSDLPAARSVAEALRQRGIRVWLDEEQLRPGQRWEDSLDELLKAVQAAILLVGAHGRGSWQNEEMQTAVQVSAQRGLPIIPVLLSGAPSSPALPPTLSGRVAIDFRSGLTATELDRLVWGITGKKPGHEPTLETNASPAGNGELETASMARLHVAGFRSLRDVTLEPGRLTVLIGPNGSGKSNLLSVLRLAPLMRAQSLRRFVGGQGGASALLHYGPDVTSELLLEIDFAFKSSMCGYTARLGYASSDALVFVDESTSFRGGDEEALAVTTSFGAGHSESLLDSSPAAGTAARLVSRLISTMSFFHFHDTSLTSPLRRNAPASESRHLRSNGSNLASFLYRLRVSDNRDVQATWNFITDLVRQIAPFIKRIEPDRVDPDKPTSPLRLYWVDHRDHRFDVNDLSDGTLRAIALIVALAQPASTLPSFIAIDEPELGLHPTAISLVASLARSASSRCQVVLSTQSPALLDEFEAEDVVVVELHGGESLLKRLSSQELAAWIDDYSLSELYDMNMLGGRP